jgi:hypothetical protein
MDERLIAVCGLDCTDCALRTSATDERAAEELAGWFRGMGWIAEDGGVAEIQAHGPYCQGCHGDRAVHWSADCWILKCCVDDKGLSFCYECGDFPCQPLGEWAAQNERYTEAFDRLRRLKEDATSRPQSTC